MARIFKVGETTIVEDESLRDLSNEQVRDMLKRTYPEVIHSDVAVREDRDTGLTVVEYKPRPGRKG